MDILEDLNSEQQKALLQTEGAVLVVAGAGSGKTRLLTHRIAYLIKEKHVSSYNILAITFTNKASREMKQRCDQIIGEEGNVWISTFHSMCARILRMDIEELGDYTKNFTIYSDQDSDKVFKNIFSTLKIDKDETKKSVMFHISNLKNNNMTIQEYENLYSYVSNFDYIKKAYFMYESELKKANALDFNDLLNKTYELLKNVQMFLKNIKKDLNIFWSMNFRTQTKFNMTLSNFWLGNIKIYLLLVMKTNAFTLGVEQITQIYLIFKKISKM